MSRPEDMLNEQYAEISWLRDALNRRMDEVDMLRAQVEALRVERDMARDLAVALEQAGNKFEREAKALALELESLAVKTETPFETPFS